MERDDEGGERGRPGDASHFRWVLPRSSVLPPTTAESIACRSARSPTSRFRHLKRPVKRPATCEPPPLEIASPMTGANFPTVSGDIPSLENAPWTSARLLRDEPPS